MRPCPRLGGEARSTDTLAACPSKSSSAAQQLLAAAESAELAMLCARSGVHLMVLFGSAARGDADPSDVDVAASFERGMETRVVSLLEELYRFTGFEDFDVLDLDRAFPLARERALTGGRLLYQSQPGLFATRQIAAIMSDSTPTRCAESNWS